MYSVLSHSKKTLVRSETAKIILRGEIPACDWAEVCAVRQEKPTCGSEGAERAFVNRKVPEKEYPLKNIKSLSIEFL